MKRHAKIKQITRKSVSEATILPDPFITLRKPLICYLSQRLQDSSLERVKQGFTRTQAQLKGGGWFRMELSEAKGC